jgi:23S rRNA pseudouridine955/2504/2580 synthase
VSGTTVEVAPEDDAVRIDRWFARHYPGLGRAALHKLLRTGQVRIDGHRVKAGTRLAVGQTVRVPPQARAAVPAETRAVAPDARTREELRARVLYRDDDMIALDKPAGLAVQGGTGQRRHLDALAEALRFEAREPPRLVHRLDKDTSGVLLLARHVVAARRLARLFRAGEVGKTYWAVVVGAPRPRAGVIDRPLAKRAQAGSEKVGEDARAKPALTRYRTIARAGTRAAWLELVPLTGRTHQLRAHCALIGTPIAGDGKYGGKAAHIDIGAGRTKRLHLLARELVVPHPDGANLRLRAPLPDHMRETFAALGFDPKSAAAEA